MIIYKKISLYKIVPYDSSVNEPYVLRCLLRAIRTKDVFYLVSALVSITIALHMHTHESSSDAILDVLVPIIRTKCNVNLLYEKLMCIDCSTMDDVHGACGYSLCTFQSAALIARKDHSS